MPLPPLFFLLTRVAPRRGAWIEITKRGEPKSIKNFINKADFKRLSNHFGVNYVYLFEDDKCFFSPIYCETKKLKFDLLEKYKFDE